MARKRSRRIAAGNVIERSIHVIRDQRVMLDADLAALYGVTTTRLNERITRNRDRFPEDFAHQLTQQEFTPSISHSVTPKNPS
jgi:hypothetical protein